ncbi:hypothetical protein [Ferviditalea candida]|uniref:Uncharacterized protein n=1 Tax=Ferviditalea candida TaxID=3108399 RepID=A0ABU5ZFE2_9BACL|nr:hypothetical protein [Paenibacillaceae bacterium T2]
MTGSNKDNVILFPKTVEYYHTELTRLLESERYREAVQLLKFLLHCQADDTRTVEEWRSLLGWLESSFPSDIADAEDAEADLTEADLFRQQVQEKAGSDRHYAKKLMEILLHNVPLEKKLLALEQLAVIDHPQICETLKRWLQTVDLPPFVQFKVLQTLKSKGMTGKIKVHKYKEDTVLEIADTPLSLDHFPPNLLEIYRKVQQVSEIYHPALAYFAEHTWKEFLASIYGTSVYEQLKTLDSASLAVWAGALHAVVTETMLGEADEREIMQLYHIAPEFEAVWEQAVRKIKSFL